MIKNNLIRKIYGKKDGIELSAQDMEWTKEIEQDGHKMVGFLGRQMSIYIKNRCLATFDIKEDAGTRAKEMIWNMITSEMLYLEELSYQQLENLWNNCETEYKGAKWI